MDKRLSDDIEAWIARLDRDDSPETRAAFNAWLAEDPRRTEEYEQH